MSGAKVDSSMPTHFEYILRPMPLREFISESWGQRFVHISGEPNKFEGLISWADLSAILEQPGLKPPRLRLVKRGQGIGPNNYVEDSEWNDSRIRSADLLRELDSGATLILNQCDDFSRPVRQLAASVERMFRCDVIVNLYAGWRSENGFTLHWDPQDTCIVQVSGRKRWTVYRPTRNWPLKYDVAENIVPDGEPYWDQIVNQGDILYIPRGWWHVAVPLEEPTLHLTVTIRRYNFIDMLHWFVESLKAHEVCRLDIAAETQAQKTAMETISAIVQSEWCQPLIERFQEAKDGARRVAFISPPAGSSNCPMSSTYGPEPSATKFF